MNVIGLLFFFLLLFSAGLWSAENPGGSGGIPACMRVDWFPGVEGDIPEVPVVLELDEEDFPPSGQDCSQVIQAAVDSIVESGAVLLPAGTFLVQGRLYIPPGVTLRGQGAGRTHLILEPPPKEGFWYGAIVIKGEGAEVDRRVSGPVHAGFRSVTLMDTADIEVGQLLWLFMQNDPEIMYPGRPEWNVEWAARAVGQMFRIESVEGNRVFLDRAVRLDYPSEREPGVRIYSPNRRAGLEGIHFQLKEGSRGTLVTFETAENGWVRNCEFEDAGGSHIVMRRSRNITIRGNYIHHGQQYSGGRAYGISADWSSTDCLIEDNILSVLRHAISTSLGANGCVWAYNYLREQTDDSPRDRLRDISLHGNYPYMNLFEGNVAEFAASSDWWGAAGPLNTFYRNRFDPSLDDPSGWTPPFQVQYHTHSQVIVANSFVRDQGIQVMEGCEGTFIEGNLIHGNIGRTNSEEIVYPASLYRNSRPAFWPEDKPWPCIGADVDEVRLKARNFHPIPAMDRYQAIQSSKGRDQQSP